MFDLMVMAQCEDESPGVALTGSQQEQPVHLALLEDGPVGLLTADPAMEPELGAVDD